MAATTIDIDNLRVGMFVHLDLGWWAHPFALSSFQVSSPDQIATIRGLGLKRVRWSPEKSRPLDNGPSGQEPGADAAGIALDALLDEPGAVPQTTDHDAARRRAALAAQRQADAVCAAQYAEAGQAWKAAAEQVLTLPLAARDTTEWLTRSLLDKMMIDGELCIRVLADSPGERAAAHALNVTVISLLMGRVFGFGEVEMLDMGVGALLHDIGKLELPERLRLPDGQFSQAENTQYREHVAHGIAHGQRMNLNPAALSVLAQHHEMADGSGFPNRLSTERMSAIARIVALVNRYDNLCNPAVPSHALTPHEALSLIFAQAKSKFDTTMLNAFIRMMGVYPPGSMVQLTDDRYATVISVNSSRPLKPRVLVCDTAVPVEEALLLNLEEASDLGIRRSLKPSQLPVAVQNYLSPRQRVVYFFEPAVADGVAQAVEALAA
ncbi:HD-GYP domain-containing protein [Aquabacterium sp.]|uniref:HD-GYP domain-containing protein n=1 Tax=Aquabacterium sp. TaxID=1872578 RepID=UPI002C65B3D1|nr:HD domain-containing phosphohydrolase [Aquabacterium sp.]HSW07809.1 HD domain-containing phosphohydrolase [Aquabacterium sp.]